MAFIENRLSKSWIEITQTSINECGCDRGVGLGGYGKASFDAGPPFSHFHLPGSQGINAPGQIAVQADLQAAQPNQQAAPTPRMAKVSCVSFMPTV
ncbi:MAG: hypothetical protein OXS28_01480 [Gammaproteobacteria bacterium]|nr:hypothetical protein [Gammaproteobacteria bacterium]